MGAGKNKAHRKKRISKHVLKSQEQRSEEEAGNVPAAETPTQSTAESSTPKSKKTKIKDPLEAASYLSTWKHRDAGVWKFNKNTQSWLIRHMYEAPKVPKATFEVLMEYLAAGGDGLRVRVLSDATKRALRYKQYEKSRSSQENNTKDATVKESADEEQKSNKKESTEGKDETEGWNALSDHDKRKEYKRSRKLVELLKDKET